MSTLAVLALCGAAAMVTPASARAAAGSASTVGGMTVSVAYAENIGDSSTPGLQFPVPWQGAVNTVFLGNPTNTSECGAVPNGQCWDTGAIRFDNPTTSAITVQSTSVNVHASQSGGAVYNLWGSFAVPAGQSVILAENPPGDDPSIDNFDTSDTPHGNCTPSTIAPTVTVTIGGSATTLVDSTHVLDDTGIDLGACPSGLNESIQWRQIGTPGAMTATFGVSPSQSTEFTGQPVQETATLDDGGGLPLANAGVSFDVTSGPDVGQTATATTNAAGQATFSYASAGQGEDVIVASAVSDVPFQATARVLLTGDSASGWSGADIGSPSPAGSATFDPPSGQWTVTGGGTSIGGASDQFQYVSTGAAVPGGIATDVASQTQSAAGEQAGVMLRATADPGAPDYAALLTPSGIVVQDRATQGGATTVVTSTPGAAPAHLWIAATGGTVATYTSTDGIVWQLLPNSAITLSLGSAPLAGLAVSSGTTSQTSTAVFAATVLTSQPPPPPPPIPCPSPWTCADIGGPASPGSSTLTGNTTWTIQGSGIDIQQLNDQFQFVYQSMASDGSLSVRVISEANNPPQDNTNPWLKAGVMMRGNTTGAAPEYSAYITPGNGVAVQDRAQQGGKTSSLTTVSGQTAPLFLKISRAGTTFSTSISSDGMTWTLVPNSTATIAALGGSILQGLAVTSHDGGVIATSTMDSVQLSSSAPPPPPCPSPWSCADVGSPAKAGTSSLSGTTWTIQGGGSDIFNNADQFQFVSQPLGGSGISARVITQGNTSPWAKAGVMLRSSTAAGSPEYALLVTPGNGIVVQYRGTSGGASSRIAQLKPGTLPAYIKVVRSGTSFSAYTSSNGTTWTLVPGSSVTIAAMSGSLLEGLCVTSHNTAALSTVTMDSVQTF